MHSMSSTPSSSEPEPQQTPKPDDSPHEASKASHATPPEEEWIEEYEEEQYSVAKPKKKKRPWASIVAVSFIIVFMVVWTVLAPPVLAQAGTTYVASNTSYANLGNYTGERDIFWLGGSIHVGRTVWGVSVSGPTDVTAGEATSFYVLITKVEEESSGFWFRGTSVDLDVSALYDDDGNELGQMVNKTKLEFGPLARISATFDSPGEYECHVHVVFRVYESMRIGFLPLEDVDISAEFSEFITVT